VTESLIQAFVGPLRETFFLKAAIGGSVAAIVCSVVGCLVILRRMAFLGDALSHAMIAGVAGGYLFVKLLFNTEAHAPSMLIGSLIATVVTVASIGFVSRVSRLKEDTVIGIMYTGVFAVGVVLVSMFRNHIHIDLMHFIMGDVLGVADSDLWVAAIAAAFVLSLIVVFFRQFQISSFDPVMAASIGMPVLLIDYTLTTCVSLVVVSAVSMVGVILVVGLLITPAATAYLLCDRLDKMMFWSAVFGVTSVIGGLYLCIWLDSAGGGAIMVFCTIQFLVVLVLAPRYGLLARWIRLKRMVPQRLVEDILGMVMRAPGGVISQQAASEFAAHYGRQAFRALKWMTREGLLEPRDGTLALTNEGRREASKIVRAHRLWEAYMEHVGMPLAQLHGKAHELEHVHDKPAVDYLDDLLGHPVYDPHGAEIPADITKCRPGDVCSLSLLREGTIAEVVSVDPKAGPVPLVPGERASIGPRLLKENLWTVTKEDGVSFTVDHGAADRIQMKVWECAAEPV
jgi:manganese/iron transport system permease protein/iron/zinc/copper transport system permease protein